MPPVDPKSRPFLAAEDSVAKMEGRILFSLLPVIAASCYVFGWAAAAAMALSVFSCLVTEMFWRKAGKLRALPPEPGAVVTAVLFVLLLPAGAPWWAPLPGGFLSVSLGRMIFGGAGQGIFNPALAGCAVLTAVPGLNLFSAQVIPSGLCLNSVLLVTGTMGNFGDISRAAVLLGGFILLTRSSVPIILTLFYLAGVAVFSPIFGRDLFYDFFLGNTLLFAFFYVTGRAQAPTVLWGRALYAFGAGSLTVILRAVLDSNAADVYALLLANAVSPLLDRCFRPHCAGEDEGRISGDKAGVLNPRCRGRGKVIEEHG